MTSSNSNPQEGVARRVLVVEDDPSISLGLRMNLEAEGYQVLLADDGEQGLALAREAGVDLLVLDVMLPKLNGFELLRRLREEGSQVPVILLSARDAELDIVMGLEFGAEDYVTKPFGLAELLARVKAVLRRTRSNGPSITSGGEASDTGSEEEEELKPVDLGSLRVDPLTRQVRRNGDLVGLTATEFDVLWCLVRCGGRVLSREEIQSQVWGPSHHGTLRTIDNFMMQLRTKLEEDPTDPHYLLTVRGVGYRAGF